MLDLGFKLSNIRTGLTKDPLLRVVLRVSARAFTCLVPEGVDKGCDDVMVYPKRFGLRAQCRRL